MIRGVILMMRCVIWMIRGVIDIVRREILISQVVIENIFRVILNY